MSRRLPLTALALLVTAAVLAGCSKDEAKAEPQTPEDVLALAQETLDSTSGVQLTLSTPGLPDGVTGISGADGVATDAPAFEGSIKVIVSATEFDVPVVSVDGVVYAQLPLTTGFQDIDPGEYNAPDPAQLVSPDNGFSSLLPATTDVVEGESVRGGDDNTEVLTEFTGTVPGSAMQRVIPSSTGDSFAATYQVTDEGELREATFTGAFYPDSGDMTYTVTFEDYGTEQEIVAPDTGQ